jgi:hypothetical protein
MLWDREELELVVRNSPFFSKGDKGGFSEHLDGNCSWSLVEPMNSIATQSLKGEDASSLTFGDNCTNLTLLPAPSSDMSLCQCQDLNNSRLALLALFIECLKKFQRRGSLSTFERFELLERLELSL